LSPEGGRALSLLVVSPLFSPSFRLGFRSAIRYPTRRFETS
jgi:hypothetical protein